MQTAFVVKPRVALKARVSSQTQARRVMVASAPKDGQIDQAVKEAEEACAGGDAGEWYVVHACVRGSRKDSEDKFRSPRFARFWPDRAL